RNAPAIRATEFRFLICTYMLAAKVRPIWPEDAAGRTLVPLPRFPRRIGGSFRRGIEVTLRHLAQGEGRPEVCVTLGRQRLVAACTFRFPGDHVVRDLADDLAGIARDQAPARDLFARLDKRQRADDAFVPDLDLVHDDGIHPPSTLRPTCAPWIMAPCP